MNFLLSMLKRCAPGIVLGFCAAAPAWPHGAPVPINKIDITVDARRLVVRFHSGAPWWVFYVLGEQTPAPTHWRADVEQKIHAYFDQHFILQADGRALPSTFVHGRYSEEVWRYYLGSQLDLEFAYALPANTRTLSGDASFYREARATRHHEADLDQPQPRFETHVTLSGPTPHRLLLTPDHANFSFPIAAVLRTPAQRALAQWQSGFWLWETAPWILLAFAAFQLQAHTRLRGAALPIVLILTAAVGAFLFAWRKARPEWGVYGLGLLSLLALAAFLIEAALRGYYRRLVRVSESQAPALFASQVRFLSLLIGGIALYLAAETLATSA